MAKLSKIDAAKAIGVSRQTLYNYVKDGRVSVDPNGLPLAGEVLLGPSGVRPVQVIAPLRMLFFWYLFWLLLAEPPDRIQRCPECATIFFRVKKQAYCSRTCGNRATQRRWRERHEVSAPTAE